MIRFIVLRFSVTRRFIPFFSGALHRFFPEEKPAAVALFQVFHVFPLSYITNKLYLYYYCSGRLPAGKEGKHMHFRVQTDEMNYGMGMVIRALSPRPAKAAYDGVLIETEEDCLVLTCTDGEISIRARVSAMVEEDGVALLPARLFSEMMRKQPAGEVDVRIDERMRAVIKSRGSNTSMSCMAAEDFPDLHDVIGEHHAMLPCNRFRNAVGKVLFAVSTDESRKILTGVLMEVYEQKTLLVGLDGFRLALQEMEAENILPDKKEVISAVVPGKVLGEVEKMLPDSEDMVQIVFNNSHIMFSFGSVKVYATLLMGEYIDYQKILPTQWNTEALVTSGAFAEAIDRCSLMAREGRNNLIYFKLLPEGKMEMTANAEQGEVHEEIDIGLEGNELSIAFNSKYLSDIIRNVDDEKIRMCFNSNVSPCMIKPVEGNGYVFLLLPVRIFNR